MTSIYSTLDFDPIAVAHRLNMPAALFEAFKKAMLGGLRGKKSQLLDYQQAVECIERFERDLIDELVRLPTPFIDNVGYIEEVVNSYSRLHNIYQLDLRFKDDSLSSEEIATYRAFLAGQLLLELFIPRRSIQSHFDIYFKAKQNLDIAIFNLYLETNKRDAAPLELSAAV
jgi:hypothetical protein